MRALLLALLCSVSCTVFDRLDPIGPTCGNGVVQLKLGEMCDDGNNLDGDGCTSRCQIESCGNGIVDSNEQCDPPDGATCSDSCQFIVEDCSDGVDNDGDGLIDCADQDCQGAPVCAPEDCGDNIVEGNEQCDPPDLTFCADDCKFFAVETSLCGDGLDNDGDGNIDCADADCFADIKCLSTSCGDGVVQAGEQCDPPNNTTCDTTCHTISPTEICDNNLDDDGDSLIDCQDPTCFNAVNCVVSFCGDGALQPGEQCEPPNTATCDATCHTILGLEICNDGIDNDNDGFIDCADFSCFGTAACVNACSPVALALDPSTPTGDTTNHSNTSDGSCLSSGGADVAFQVTVANTGTLSITLQSVADLGVYVQTSCGDPNTQQACAHDSNGGSELITLPVNQGDVFFVFVDGFDANDAGPFSLNIRSIGLVVQTEICENSLVDDDLDGLPDCSDSDCTTDPLCFSDGAVRTGETCTQHAECATNSGLPACLTDLNGFNTFQNGYCSEFCDLGAPNCQSVTGTQAAICEDVGFTGKPPNFIGGMGLCFDLCRIDAANVAPRGDCRSNYDCVDDPGGTANKICQPH